MAPLSPSQPPTVAIADSPPEWALLLLVARTHCSPAAAATLRSLRATPDDWQKLVDLARCNGVVPLLYTTLKTLGVALPEALQRSLEAEFSDRARQNLIALQQQLALVGGLAQADILAVPFKGPLLAQTVYGNVALRCFVDLDLWVYPEAAAAVGSWLQAQGFEVLRDLQWECHFIHPQARINVDVHYAITSAKFPFKLTLDRVVSRLRPLSLGGKTVQQLAPEDTLLTLCAGWCKDCWGRSARLAQLCDVAELLRSQPQLDWPYLLDQARTLDAEAMLLLPLALAHSWLEAPLPAAIRDRIQASPRVQQLRAHLHQTFWQYPTHGGDRSPETLSTRDHVLYFGLRSSFMARLTYLARLIITPTEKEKQLLSLPRWLGPVYIPVRLVRLVHKYGRYCLGRVGEETMGG